MTYQGGRDHSYVCVDQQWCVQVLESQQPGGERERQKLKLWLYLPQILSSSLQGQRPRTPVTFHPFIRLVFFHGRNYTVFQDVCSEISYYPMLVDIGQFPHLLIFSLWDMTPNFYATEFSLTADVADGDRGRTPTCM